MAQRRSDREDLLGIVALGSVIGNVVQAKDKNRLADHCQKLNIVYQQLLTRYRQVCREYEQFRNLNSQLQSTVLALRKQNDDLMRKMAKVTQK